MIFEGYEDPDLYELGDDSVPFAGDQGLLEWPTATLIGGRPYGGSVFWDGGTYIIKRQGDMVLTPTGWHHISELQ